MYAFPNSDDGSGRSVVWQSPPLYWERIVYPAYKRAHEHLFKDGDVEDGELIPGVVKNLRILEGSKMGIEAMLERSCQEILGAVTGFL